MRAFTNFVVERPVGVGTAKVLQNTDQNGTFLLDTSTGSTATLPASVGDGGIYNFLMSVAPDATATHVVKVANTGDIIQGGLAISRNDATGTTVTFGANATSDTITLNGGTSGGVRLGDWLEVVDLKSGTFVVKGQLSGTTTTAAVTAFSAGV
jgi:hypothetical protein